MTDYAEDINISNYKYSKKSYFTNPYPETKKDLIIKMVLTENDFNFNLTEDGGVDFRLVSIGTLKMWRAHWSKEDKHAVIFFKLPEIGPGEKKTLTAYWGYELADDISTPEEMDFIFYEDFPEVPLSPLKWTGYTNGTLSTYGYYISVLNQTITTITNPLSGLTSWVVEAGMYCDWDAANWSSISAATGFTFLGTENDFYVQMMHVDRAQTNGVAPAQSYDSVSTKLYGGLEPRSYQDLHVSYYEPEDKIILKLLNRESYEDVEHSWQRKVEGDTRPDNVGVLGARLVSTPGGARPTYISWLLIREYEAVTLSPIDVSEFYIPYAYVPPQLEDRRSYSQDLTSVIYSHESSFGGNPYKLSDEGFDSSDNYWVSDDNAATETDISVTIHLAAGDDITDSNYTHYDSGHTYYDGAAKLSDDDTDNMAHNFWRSTTTSGWAAIKFTQPTTVGSFRVRSTSNAPAFPKDFIFYGSNSLDFYDFTLASNLVSGTFEDTDVWQLRVLRVVSAYRYYMLYVFNTQGDSNIEVQEWEMSTSLMSSERKYVRQLRLHPAIYDDLEYNFPKEISFLGTVDGVNWDTLIPWQQTYTPFISHTPGYGQWQLYSFFNDKGYWSFKLLMRGNWEASDNKIAIGEWSIHELSSEEYTYHILSGETNSIQQIWASDDCGLDDGGSLFFVANEAITKVSGNKLVGTLILPDYYEDFNVTQGS